jgi:hypothetical protein
MQYIFCFLQPTVEINSWRAYRWLLQSTQIDFSNKWWALFCPYMAAWCKIALCREQHFTWGQYIIYVYPYELGSCHHCMEHPRVVTGGECVYACMHACMQSFGQGKRLSASITMQWLCYCLSCITLTVAVKYRAVPLGFMHSKVCSVFSLTVLNWDGDTWTWTVGFLYIYIKNKSRKLCKRGFHCKHPGIWVPVFLQAASLTWRFIYIINILHISFASASTLRSFHASFAEESGLPFTSDRFPLILFTASSKCWIDLHLFHGLILFERRCTKRPHATKLNKKRQKIQKYLVIQQLNLPNWLSDWNVIPTIFILNNVKAFQQWTHVNIQRVYNPVLKVSLHFQTSRQWGHRQLLANLTV